MSSSSSWSCDICRKDCDDPVEYGEICVQGSVKSHYYCLLLSTHLMQRGSKDTSGILGFYINDIKKEIIAAKTRKCGYCKEYHASIKCSCCDIYFHLKCGLENYCLFQFINEFKSYCHEHHNIRHDKPHSPDAGCFICRKKMKTYNPITSITSNCCSTNGWVHRKCLKIYALAAGYYLKCLWCVNSEFRNYVRLHGVFVPDRDAAWEKIKENYAGLYEHLKRKCFAQKCLCPQGRDYKSKKWNIEVCSVCGAFAIHKLCYSDEISAMDNEIICKRCNELSKTKYNIVKIMNETGLYYESTSYDATMFLSKTYWFPTDKSFSCKLSQQNTPHFLTSSDEENMEELNELNKQRIDHTENKTKDNNENSLLTTFHFNTETLEIYKITKPGDDESESLISIPKDNTVELDNFIHQLFKEEIEAMKKN